MEYPFSKTSVSGLEGNDEPVTVEGDQGVYVYILVLLALILFVSVLPLVR